MNNQSKFGASAIARLAMMTAVSVVLLLIVRIPFPPAPFLVYDPADVPIYITAFAFGPAAGLLVTLVVCLIQAFLLGGDGLYGFLMHFVATGIVAVVIGLMYSKCKTRKRAVTALVVGVIVATAVMCIMNLISQEILFQTDLSCCVTPVYMGAPREAVIAMLPTAIIPFNLLKAGLNSILTFILYKRVSGFLHGGSAVKAAEGTR